MARARRDRASMVPVRRVAASMAPAVTAPVRVPVGPSGGLMAVVPIRAALIPAVPTLGAAKAAALSAAARLRGVRPSVPAVPWAGRSWAKAADQPVAPSALSATATVGAIGGAMAAAPTAAMAAMVAASYPASSRARSPWRCLRVRPNASRPALPMI